MLAAILSISIFCYFVFIGFAVQTLLGNVKDSTRALLIAPAVGFSTLLIPTLTLSRIGLPIKSFALGLTLILFAGAVVILRIRRPAIKWREYAPYVPIFFLAFLMCLRPFFEFGFNWVSVSNEDFTNYSLSADRFVNFAYLTPPKIDSNALFTASGFSFLQTVASGERCGADMGLALVLSIFHLRSFQGFMPFIGAGFLALISCGSALAAHGKHANLRGYIAATAMAISSLVTLGLVLQLLGQVYGLMLLLALCALFLNEHTFDQPLSINLTLISAIVLSGLFATYPEVSVFYFGATAILILTLIAQRRIAAIKRIVIYNFFAAVLMVIILNQQAIKMAYLLSGRSVAAQENALNFFLYPYYLTPAGFADYWGLLPVGKVPPDPVASIAIGFGILLSGISLFTIFRAALQRSPAGLISIVMLALGVTLLRNRADYGLYKLAMYSTPFVLISFSYLAPKRYPRLGIMAMLIVSAIGLYAQWFYVQASRAIPSTQSFGFIEIPRASYDHLVEKGLQLIPNGGSSISSDANTAVLFKYELGFVHDSPVFFESQPALNLGSSVSPLIKQVAHDAHSILNYGKKRVTEASFSFSASPADKASFFLLRAIPHDRGYFLSTGGVQTILNRSKKTLAADITAKPTSETNDDLAIVDSTLGYIPGPSARSYEYGSIFQVEPDPFSNAGMAAIGRYMLFEVNDPKSSMVRVVLDFSTTLVPQRQLPQATLIGAKIIPFETIGDGSARIVSAPIRPMIVNGRSYIGIDMNRDGRHFPNPSVFFFRLFGSAVPLDARRSVAFARNISVISPEEYSTWKAPSMVRTFPADLYNTFLEYSGVYEDGWMSRSCRFTLRRPIQHPVFHFSGFIPQIRSNRMFATTVKVYEDNKLRLKQLVRVGNFDLRFVTSPENSTKHISIIFDHDQRLPGTDGRPVAANINEVGFVDGTGTDILTAGSSVTVADNWYPFERYEGQMFRWMANDGQLVISSKARVRRELEITAAPGPSWSDPSKSLDLLNDSGHLVQRVHLFSKEKVKFTVLLRHGDNVFRLHVNREGKPISTDRRILDIQVFRIGSMPLNAGEVARG